MQEIAAAGGVSFRNQLIASIGAAAQTIALAGVVLFAAHIEARADGSDTSTLVSNSTTLISNVSALLNDGSATLYGYCSGCLANPSTPPQSAPPQSFSVYGDILLPDTASGDALVGMAKGVATLVSVGGQPYCVTTPCVPTTVKLGDELGLSAAPGNQPELYLTEAQGADPTALVYRIDFGALEVNQLNSLQLAVDGFTLGSLNVSQNRWVVTTNSNATFQPAPEPTSLAILASGLVILALANRYRRSRKPLAPRHGNLPV